MGHVFSDSETTAVLTSEPPQSVSEKAKVNWRALRDCAAQEHTENIRLRARIQAFEAKIEANTDAKHALRAMAASEEELSGACEQAFERAAEKAARELRAFKPTGDARWNAIVQERQREARAFFFGETDLETAATLAHFAIAFRATMRGA